MNEKYFTLHKYMMLFAWLALAVWITGCGDGANGADSPFFFDPSDHIGDSNDPGDSKDPDDPKDTGMAAQVLALTNEFRAQNGVAPLAFNAQLTVAAQGHAQSMSDLGFFSHTGDDGSSAGDRILEAGYRWRTWGENIAYGYANAQAVMNGWINSSGHRANMLNAAFKEIGIGYAAGKSPYWVQNFAAK